LNNEDMILISVYDSWRVDRWKVPRGRWSRARRALVFRNNGLL